MTDLVRYDAMCSAIAECHRVDEVKDLRDKARALELYAKQSRNTDAERRACEIRLRAEIRTGELLQELARTPPEISGRAGGQGLPSVGGPSPYAEALARTGISTQTASRFQSLANVPKEIVEAAFRDPVKPTTAGLLKAARDPQPQMSIAALWIWGRVRDFERDGFRDKDPAMLYAEMTETMQADMVRIVPLLAEFFNRMEEVTHEFA